MPDTRRVTIPYESLDPLTIGASEDDALVYRDELQIIGVSEDEAPPATVRKTWRKKQRFHPVTDVHGRTMQDGPEILMEAWSHGARRRRQARR